MLCLEVKLNIILFLPLCAQCTNHPIKWYQCVMHSQGQAGAQNAQWTHRWRCSGSFWSGLDRFRHRDWDNKGTPGVLERTSCHYGHDFHTASEPPPPLTSSMASVLSCHHSHAQFVLKKVRRVSENRIKWRQIGAFCWCHCLCCCCYCSIILLSAGATGGSRLYTILALVSILPVAAWPLLTVEILMRRINYSYKVPSQIE